MNRITLITTAILDLLQDSDITLIEAKYQFNYNSSTLKDTILVTISFEKRTMQCYFDNLNNRSDESILDEVEFNVTKHILNALAH